MKTLPAGLTATDTRAEFYSTAPVSKGGILRAVYQGKTFDFWDLPMRIIQAISLRFQKDRDAAKTFPDEMPWSEKLEKFATCNLGGFDNVPDFDRDGNIRFEYWDCGMRGKCPHEFKRCKPDCIIKTHLSKREVEIVKLTAQGLQNKEIADKLNIAESTVPTHETNIRAKLNLSNRSEVTRWAINNNLA
jgi:DNA-binding CsgD family transcriptional regulator